MENPAQLIDIVGSGGFELSYLNVVLGQRQNTSTGLRNVAERSKLKVFRKKTKASFKRVLFKKRQQEESEEPESRNYIDESGEVTRPALEIRTATEIHIQEKAGDAATMSFEGASESASEKGTTDVSNVVKDDVHRCECLVQNEELKPHAEQDQLWTPSVPQIQISNECDETGHINSDDGSSNSNSLDCIPSKDAEKVVSGKSKIINCVPAEDGARFCEDSDEEGIIGNALASVRRAAGKLGKLDDGKAEDTFNEYDNPEHVMEIPEGFWNTVQNNLETRRALWHRLASIETPPGLPAHPSTSNQNLDERIFFTRVLEISKELKRRLSKFFQVQFKKVKRSMMTIVHFLGRTFQLRMLRSVGSLLLIDLKLAIMRLVWKTLYENI